MIILVFDDFGAKNDQKVSHNMILMSKYKGQHGGKKGKRIRARPPPLFGQCPKEINLLWEVFLREAGAQQKRLFLENSKKASFLVTPGFPNSYYMVASFMIKSVI